MKIIRRISLWMAGVSGLEIRPSGRDVIAVSELPTHPGGSGLVGQSRVSSEEAFLAQSSSTIALPALAAAMRAAMAALLSARGKPKLA